MPPKGKIQTNQELQERLDILEAGHKLKVADLPMDALKRELRKEPQDPNELLLPKSIGPELLARDAPIVRSVVRTFTGLTYAAAAANILSGTTVTIPEDGYYWFTTGGDFIAGTQFAVLRIARAGELMGPQCVYVPSARSPLCVSSYPAFVSLKAGETVGMWCSQTGEPSTMTFVDCYLAGIKLTSVPYS